jgi:hypothetical protein
MIVIKETAVCSAPLEINLAVDLNWNYKLDLISNRGHS